MCLREDILCILSPVVKKSGNDAMLEAMHHSRFSVSAPALVSVLSELEETHLVYTYTEEGRKDGTCAQERIKCTLPLYRRYRLTRLGSEKRRNIMSRKRAHELKQRRRTST